AYWKHITTQLTAMLGECPIFFYNTHVVWLHLEDRKESQQNYLSSFDTEGRYAGFVVGGDTAIDKEFRNTFNRKYLQVDLRKIDAIKHDSLTVHGPYIITVRFNKKTNTSINELYIKSTSAQELETSLKDLFAKGEISVRLTVERSSRKALRVR